MAGGEMEKNNARGWVSGIMILGQKGLMFLDIEKQ